MRRRTFIALVLSAALPWPDLAIAQPTSRPRKIGVFVGHSANDPVWLARFAALKKGLRELGWEEGKNFFLIFDMLEQSAHVINWLRGQPSWYPRALMF